MARIIHPEDFSTQQSRFGSIYDKNKGDGASSDVAPFLKEKSIVMDALKTGAASAAVFEKTRLSYSNISVIATEARDHHFEDVWKFTIDGFQFLKKFYKKDLSKLLDWGAPVVGGSKLSFPSEFIKRHDIVLAFLKKHADDGKDSLLNSFVVKNNINVATLTQHATDALDAHKTSEANALLAEGMTAKRDELWKPIWQTTKDITDFLAGLNNNNKKALGEWGVVVDNSPRKPKERNSVVKPQAKKLSNGIVNGSSFENTGKTELHVYPGKTTVGNPNIVKAGEKLNMGKGFSTITVVNMDLLEAGSFKVLVTKD
jgi:hypothetical protein